jgi:hypothetical protein
LKRNQKEKKIKSIFKIPFTIFLISLLIFMIILQFSSLENIQAVSYWEQNTKIDFKSGTMENVSVLDSGEIILKKQARIIEDNFENDLNISYSKNMKLNTKENKWELIKNIGNYDGFYWGAYVNNTSDDGYIMVGSTTLYGAGGFDVLLIKVDKNLDEEWKKTFGSSSSEEGSCVQQTTDEGFIIVGTKGIENNLWLIKTDNYGNEEWDKSFENGIGYSVQQTKDNGFIIGGSTSGLGSSWDGWLIKTDSYGNEQWNKTFGGFGQDNIYSVLQNSDGGFIALGLSNSYGGEDDDIWVIKTDKNGEIIWNKTYGGSSSDAGYSIKQTSDGGYIIVGKTDSYASYSDDFWIVKINSAGIEQWNKSYDFDNGVYENGRSIIQTKDNGYIVIGDTDQYAGSTSSESDVIFFKINSLGNLQWKKSWEKDGYDRGYSILKNSDNDFVILVKMGDTKLMKIDNNGNIKFVSGEMISKNMLIGENATSLNSFRYEVSIPSNTNIKIQFSQNNKSWYNSEGILNKWTLLDNGKNIIDISNLNWQGSNFYYKLDFYSVNLSSPSINFIEIHIDKYFNNGFLESQLFDSGGNLTWSILNWDSYVPPQTIIKFQLRTGNNETDLLSKQFVGPNGEKTSYYFSSGTKIWGEHDNDSWIQFKVYLLTNNTAITPILNNVTILFDYYPNLNNIQVTPDIGNITTFFSFKVTYKDRDNDLPNQVYICIDDINYSMKECNNSDYNTSKGKDYYYETKLKAGNHSYYFFASDGFHNCSTYIQELEVNFGPLSYIEIFPKLINLSLDDFQIFTAKGFDLDGNYISIKPIWEINGGGKIDQNGNFTPLIPGNWVIYANISNISGNAQVTVLNRKIDNLTDSDNDQIPDNWELKYNLNVSNPQDSQLDFDNDYLTNFEEFLNQTNPINRDTDGDGFYDGFEVDNGTNPLDENDYPEEDKPKSDENDTSQNDKYLIYIIFGVFIVIFLIIFGLFMNKKYRKNK